MSSRCGTLDAKQCFQRQVDCKVAWICVLEKEFFAAIQVLDEVYGMGHELPIIQTVNDRNVYCMGRVGLHDVVLNCPSGSTGMLQASRIVSDVDKSFPSVRFALVVGIGGGAPYLATGQDVRLGDVVIGNKVVKYKSGKRTDDDFLITEPPRTAPENFLSLLTTLTFDLMKGHGLQFLVEEAASKGPSCQIDYSRPQVDHLFKTEVLHDANRCDCLHARSEQVVDSKLISRHPREQRDLVRVHKGTIGSADQVLRNARERDALAVKEKILCVEMEAGGVMMHKSAIIVKGISDYADGHKNDVWHHYAALTAAVCAKQLLQRAPPRMVETEERVFGIGDLLGFAHSTITGAKQRQRDGLHHGNESDEMGTSIDLVKILCAYFSSITNDEEKTRLRDASTEDASTEDASTEDASSARKLAELTQAQEEMRKFITQLSHEVDQRAKDASSPVTRQEWEELKAKVDNTAKDVDQLKVHTDALRDVAGLTRTAGELARNPRVRETGEKFDQVADFTQRIEEEQFPTKAAARYRYRISRPSSSRPAANATPYDFPSRATTEQKNGARTKVTSTTTSGKANAW